MAAPPTSADHLRNEALKLLAHDMDKAYDKCGDPKLNVRKTEYEFYERSNTGKRI